MATGKMFECETTRRFRTADGQTELRWVVKSVKDIEKQDAIRCAHCEGPVKIYRQRKEDGPADHVQHLSVDDAKHCKGGGTIGPDDPHRMSSKPVQ
jgi:hypothetical protein